MIRVTPAWKAPIDRELCHTSSTTGHTSQKNSEN